MSVLKPNHERLARPVPQMGLQNVGVDRDVVGRGGEEAAKLNELLPRGADVVRHTIDRQESARWARAGEILRYRATPGSVILGKYGDGNLIGVGGDRPIVTVAPARSGKSSTVLLPTLYTYPQSMLVLDPKGELAQLTAAFRRKVLGQKVYVHDPSRCSGLISAAYNPLAELDPNSDRIVDDVDAIANTMIIDQGGSEGNFWSQISRTLVRGLIFYALTLEPKYRTLPVVRSMLELTFPPLVELKRQLEAKKVERPELVVQNALFQAMADQGNKFGGNLSGVGATFLAMDPKLQSNVLTTARAEMKFLASLTLQDSACRCDFRLAELAERPTTIYLCMSPSDLEEQFRWLRLVVRQALKVLEARGTWPRDVPHILFMMEEFPVLKRMAVMESAAAYMPGFGVRLWAVLQDLTQLTHYYRDTWETFLGNAGVRQFFANSDKKTLDYISDCCGSLSFVRGSIGAIDPQNEKGARDYIAKERLAYGHEIAKIFSRDTGLQCLLLAGESPMAISRLTHDDVQRLKAKVMRERGFST